MADGISEVISRLRATSDEGTKYSGDLLSIMDVLRNTTEIYKGAGYSLSNADVEVSQKYCVAFELSIENKIVMCIVTHTE